MKVSASRVNVFQFLGAVLNHSHRGTASSHLITLYQIYSCVLQYIETWKNTLGSKLPENKRDWSTPINFRKQFGKGCGFIWFQYNRKCNCCRNYRAFVSIINKYTWLFTDRLLRFQAGSTQASGHFV